MLKADLHIHSNFSFDSSNTPEQIIERCKQIGINCIAIADHGTAEGGLATQRISPFPVIVAEEILTPAGEIMGMFLKETIPTNIPLSEAIVRIKAQDGLVCVPHPFDTLTRQALGAKVMEEIINDINIIEVLNARSPITVKASVPVNFAAKHRKACSAGSDAHTIPEIGNAFVEMPEFTTKKEFLNSLRQGEIHGKKASPLVHFGSLWARVKKRL
ncbi:MAG: PHP domain-containing protein [Dehalococcoidales bacterium]|nr:PHP domain-containing protein [Dehalococcoidales bacterium]